MTKAPNTTTQTLVAEMPERIVYSSAIAALFRMAAEPELLKADAAIADREAAIAKMQGEIEVWRKHADGIKQAVREIDANTTPTSPIAPARCGSCQEVVVYGDLGWVHAGRELKDDGHLCNPGMEGSPAAKPAAPGEFAHNPDALMRSIEAAHDAYDAAEGGRR